MSNESDIESLVTQFHKTLAFTKSQETINKTKMPNSNESQSVNYTLLKIFIDSINKHLQHITTNILPFNGDPNTLNSFLSAGDFLFSTYGQGNDHILNTYLIR